MTARNTPAAPRSAPDRRRRAARTPVERLLPAAILSELRAAARSGEQITKPLAQELDRRLRIEERFGVSQRRLRNFLAKLAGAGADAGAESGPTRPGWAGKVRDHRRRQASIASILDATFGRLTECSPDLWERRAYLMLVGLTYERLAAGADEVTTDELVTLANVLAKLHAGAGGKHTNGKLTSTGSGASRDGGPLPKRFADAVREVYGADLHVPGAGDHESADGVGE